MKLRKLGRMTAFLLLIGTTPAFADEMRRETVQFARGTSGSTLTSTVKGYNSVQYSLSVKAG